MMQNLRRFWVYIRPDAWLFALTILLMPVQAGLGIAQPLVLKKILDEHLVVGKPEGLQSWALVWLGLVVASFLVQCGYVLALSFVAENSILRLRQDLYKQILSLSQRFYEGQPTGQIMTRATSDVDALSESITMGSVSLLLDLLTMLSVLAAMALLD
ncbi:MAG TPA: ABC transporter transmembrane domain-containing protein, partial [Myxococcota bacterium]|nr:ABC transporter transmembrane domain-containing protein [Myxococcota bacterium]